MGLDPRSHRSSQLINHPVISCLAHDPVNQLLHKSAKIKSRGVPYEKKINGFLIFSLNKFSYEILNNFLA